jgi:hypothetical protein
MSIYAQSLVGNEIEEYLMKTDYMFLNVLLFTLLVLGFFIWATTEQDVNGWGIFITLTLLIGSYCIVAVADIRRRLAAGTACHLCFVNTLQALAGHVEEQLVLAHLAKVAEENPRVLRRVFDEMSPEMVANVAREIDRRIVEVRDVYLRQIPFYQRRGTLAMEDRLFKVRLRRLNAVLSQLSYALDRPCGERARA